MTPAAALRDPALLGAALGDPEPWRAWLVILRAAFGEPLLPSERRLFARLAGGRRPPRKRVAEMWVVAGRRGGKTRMAAALAAWLGAFEAPGVKRAAGERLHVLFVAPTMGQAAESAGYVSGFLGASPILKRQVLAERTTGIDLKGGITIGCHPASFRSIRGRTLVGCILDESAFMRDEASALPDVELYRAAMPALATTGGLMIGISSPYRRVGLLAQKHRDHFGKDDPDVLVIQAGTELLNPTINTGVIARARLADPEAASSEWDAEFRSGLSTLLDEELIQGAINRDRPLELPFQARNRYFAFGDASGGRHDAFTLCIGHVEDDRFIADVVRGRKPPFDPAAVAAEYAELCKAYRVSEITTDNYSGEWVAATFKAVGMTHKLAPAPKSALYLEALPMFTQGLVSIPDLSPLIRELRLLERRVGRSGKDTVDHPSVGGSDDLANALVGCMAIAAKPAVTPMAVVRIRGLV